MEMKKILIQFNQSFLGRASILLSGSFFGQGLAFLVLPLLTRIYSPDSLGRAASTLAIFNIISIVICLQYEQAIIVAGKEELPYLLILGFSIGIGWVLLIGIVLGFTSLIWKNAYLMITAYGANTLLLLLLLTYAPFILLSQFYLKSNQLKKVGNGRFIYYGIGSIFQVIAGYLFGGTEYIFLATQIIVAVIATVYLFPFKVVLNWVFSQRENPQTFLLSLIKTAQNYRNFPKYQAEANLANAISIQLPVLFMRVMYSAEWAGWYFLAWRLLAAPTALISQAIGQLFYRDSAERERAGMDQGIVIENIVMSLIKVSLFPAVLLGLSAPLIIIFVGKSWSPVVTIIQILLPAFVVVFFTSPISTLINVKGLQLQGFIFFNIILITRAIGIVLGSLIGKEIGVIWAFTLASIITLLPFSSFVVNRFGGSMSNVFIKIIPSIMDLGLIVAMALLLNYFELLYRPPGVFIILALLFISLMREFKRSKRIILFDRGVASSFWQNCQLYQYFSFVLYKQGTHSMQILFVCSYYKPAFIYGGPVQSIARLCEGLAHAGAAVSVFTTNANGSNKLDVPLLRPLNIEGVSVSYFPLTFNGLSFFYSSTLSKKILDNASEFDIIIAETLWGHALIPIVKVCSQNNIPFVVSARGQLNAWALGKKHLKKKIYLSVIGKRLINRAAAIYCTDPTEATSVNNMKLSPPAFIIPNGINSSKYSPPQTPNGIRIQFGIPSDAVVLLFLGRLTQIKRPDIAVDVLAATQSLDRNIHLLFVGPDEEGWEMRLKEKAQYYKCEEKIHFAGLLDRMGVKKTLFEVDLLLMPSEILENFGNSALEAMAAGVPVLVSDGIPIGCWVNKAGAGRVVPCKSELFQSAAIELLSKPELLRRMGVSGRRLVHNYFDIKTIAQGTLNQYEAIIATGKPLPDNNFLLPILE
jgi:glycosyltransferase involved in cell wall biosynthesis/O-antigen/teichoic acid export membrane protein